MQAGGSGGSLNADINVTPFVDICLVLLIIFMVVTPMLQEGVQINLPVAKNTEKKDDDEKSAIVVAIKNADTIYVQRKQIPRESFQNEMTEIFARMPEKPVLIKADRTMTYGDVRKVMIEANEAGFESVSLVAETQEGAQ